MFVRKITDPKPVFNDWRPELWHLEKTGCPNISYGKVEEKDKLWSNKCIASKEKLKNKDDNFENEDIMPSFGINGPQASQVFDPPHGYSAINLGKEKSSDLGLLFHNYSTVPDASGINKTNDKTYFKKLNQEALKYGSNRMYKYPETNEIPAFYKDSDQTDSTTDSQADQSTRIHYLNEHIPTKARDSRSSAFVNNPSALFAPYYPSVPEFHPEHVKESLQNVKNSSPSLSPLKTVAQEELARSLPEISTDGLDKLKKLVEQQRKDREYRINSLGLHLNPSSKNYHYAEEPVVPNVSARSHTSRTVPEKHSKIRLVASAPPVSRYKGFSIPSTNSNESNEKTSKLRKTCHTTKDGGVSEKNQEIATKVKKSRTRISACRDKPPKDNASGIITTWAWRHCQDAAFRELGDFKMISTSSHSPPTHDTDQQTVNVSAKQDTESKPPSSTAIDDLKAMLDSSKKILSEEARTILNDLQLTKLSSDDDLKSKKDGDKERNETNPKLVTEAESNISSRNFNASINKKPSLKISSKRKATKATDAENLPVAKHRHYNSEDVRKYIAQQQADRKRRQLQEQEATKVALEQRNKRLKELYIKQKETVLHNKYIKTYHKKEPLPKSPLTLFSTDSNNKLTTAQQVSELMEEQSDKENIEDIFIKHKGISDTSEIDEDDDTNDYFSNDDLSDPAKNRIWTSPNHPFVTVRSNQSRNSSLSNHDHTPTYFKTSYSSLSPPIYHHSPNYNVTSNNYYHSPHSVELTSRHSLPNKTMDDYLVEPNNHFGGTTSRESRLNGPYTNPVPSSAYNDYLRMNLRNKDRMERIKAIKEVADSLQGRIVAQTQQFNQEINPATGSKSFQNSNIQLSDFFDEEDFPMTRYDRITYQDTDYHVFDDKVPGVRNLSEHLKVLEKEGSRHKAATRIQAAYRGYHTRHSVRRPNDKIKSRNNLSTPDPEENSHNSANHTSLSTGPLATDDSDLVAYSKRLARNMALTTECWKLKSDLHSPSDSRSYNLPLPIPEPDQHSVINIFMQRLKEEEKDKLHHLNKPIPTVSSFGHHSSLQTDSRSSSPVDGQDTPNSTTSISKTSSPSLSPTSFQRPKRHSTNLDTSRSSMNKRFSYNQSSFNRTPSAPPLPIDTTSQKAKSSVPTVINNNNDNGIDKEMSLSWKTTNNSISKTASPDNTLNMSASLTDEETSNVIKSQSIDRHISEHSKIETVPHSPEYLESRTQLEINQFSPTTLHLKLAAELARLETVEESLKQLDHIERARAIALAQQETVSLAHILKARQQNHKQEIENLSVQMKQESSNNLEEIRRMAAETVQTTAENVVKLSQDTTATIQDSAHKLIQAQTETVKVAAEAAKQLAEAQTASLMHLSTGSALNTNKIAAEAASAAVSVAIATALDEQRKQQVEFFRHFRKDTISTPPKEFSLKSESVVSLPIPIGLENLRGSKSTSALLKKKSDSRESSSSIVTAYDSSKINKSVEHSQASKSQSRSEIIPEEDENSSVRLDEFTEEEAEINEQSHHISPSENHRSNKREKSHTVSISSESNLTTSDKWKLADQNLFSAEDSFKKYTSEMIKQYMADEEVRAKHHAALLKLRERALKEKTKAEMAWLELQKKRLKDKGADDLMPPLRKKQRGLLMRFQEERAEIKRLKEAQKLATEKRQLLLYQQQEITRIQQSTQHILEKIKKSGLRLSQQSVSTEDEVSMPIYDGSQSDFQDEASAALPTDNSMTDNASETPSLLHDIPPSDTVSKVMKKLKKLESQSSTRYLTKREQKLRQRREHIEALLAWGENLDKEEAEISNMEKKALELLGKQEKAVQAPESSSPKDKVEIDKNSITQDIEEESYLNNEELKSTSNRSEIEEDLPCEKRRKNSYSDSSISEDSHRLKYSTSEEKNIETKQDLRKMQIFFGSDNFKTSYSISTHDVSEGNPSEDKKIEASLPSSNNSLINTKSESIKEVTSPSKSLASSWHSKSDDSSSIDSISPPKNSPSLQSKNSKEIMEDIHTAKGPGSNSRDPSMSLKAPLSPRPAQKRRESSCSEDSISMSHSETASDQSDMEGRIRALKEELKRRKIEVARLKREQKRRNHERLRAQEASLLIQIEAYDKFIIQAKDELNKELELDVKAPGLKPQIKQPRRLQRHESTEAILLRTTTNLRSDEIRDNDDVFKAISPGWMSDQLSALKRVSLESIDESIELSESPTLRDLPGSEITSEIDEEGIKDEITESVATEQSDGSQSVKSNSTVKNKFISLHGSVNIEDSSLQIEVNKSVIEGKEKKTPEVEIKKVPSEILSISSEIETVKESTMPEEIEHDNSVLDVYSNVSTRNEPTIHDLHATSECLEASYSDDFSETSFAIEGGRSRTNSGLSNKSLGVNVFEGERSRSNSELSNKSSSLNEKEGFMSKNDEKSKNISYLNSSYETKEISEHSSNSSHTISHLEELKKPQIGDRVNIEGSMMGTLRFIGKTLFASGFWAGVELDHAEGNCNGAVDGVEYFHCDFNCGLFVPLNKISLSAIRNQDEKEVDDVEIEEELPSKDSQDTLVEEKSPHYLFQEIEQLQEKEMSLEIEQNSVIDRSSNESLSLDHTEIGNIGKSFEFEDNIKTSEKIETEKTDDVKEIMNSTPEDKTQDSDIDLQDVIFSTALAVEQFSSSPLPWLLAEEKKADSKNESTMIEEKRRLALNGLVDKITDSLANMIIQDSVSVISSIAKQQNIVKKAEKQNSSTENLINKEIIDSSTTYEIHIEEEMIIEISDDQFTEHSKQTLAAEISQTLTQNLLNDAITHMMNIGKERIKSNKLLELNTAGKEANIPETTLDKVHSLLARHSEKKKEHNWSKTTDIFALSPQDAYSDALESPEFPSPVHVPSEKRATSPTSEVDEIMKGRQGGDSREGSASPTSPVPRPSSPVFGEPAPLNQAELKEKLATLHFLDMDIMEGSVFGEQSLFGDQEWFDDDFGLGHQKDSHNRQIPPKPAPPYTPPAQWNLSQLDLKKITAKVFCAVPHNEKDVQELINIAVKEFYNRRKYGEPLVDVPPPVNYFTRDDRNEDIESRSRRTYKHFLFELTGFLVQEIYGDDEAPERPIWMKPARILHHKFCKRCPTNEQELQEIVLNSINQLLGFTPMAKQEWPYVKWSRKKKDCVDEILVQELREEEQSWVIYDDDELSVKMQLTDAILDSLILDTVRTFSLIFAKKQAKLNSNYDY